jgi:multisubunit Na+/H+ antiporter MnhG subunit
MLEPLIEIAVRLLVVPLFVVLTTPVILVCGFFGKGSYWRNVRSYYTKVSQWVWTGV